jgi:hypothetical protein
MLILEPTVVAAQTLWDDDDQTIITPTVPLLYEAPAATSAALNKPATMLDPLQSLEKTLQQWQTQLSIDSNTRKRGADNITQLQPSPSELKAQLIELDAQVMSEFDEIEASIRDNNLPDEILERHFQAIARYSQEKETLYDNLDAIENAPSTQKQRLRITRALQHQQPLTPSQHVPFNPDNLPFSFPTGNIRTPLLTKAAFQKRFGFMNSEVSTRRSNRKRNPKPNDTDLSATEDIQITPEIEALAQELKHHPILIYNWVRNHIDFIPTYGSVKGSALTLMTKSGNAFDTASLLIALLRASNIPARYVYGTVEMPTEKVINWLKVKDANQALDLLSQSGIPNSAVVSAGAIKFIRMEHIWVDAWVDFYPSRAARHRKGDSWAPLDASFKQYTFHKGIQLEKQVPFDNQQAWLDAIPNIAENQDWITGIDEQQIETLFDEYDAQLQAYVDQNQPDISLADTLDSYTIIPENRSRLSMGLPYRLLVKGTLFSTLPSQLRYNITVRIYNSLSDQRLDNPSLNQTISLPAINDQRLGLTYEPASESDAIALQNYRLSEIETLPAYLFKLKPVLKLENTALATGTAIGMGQQQHLTIIINDPVRGPLTQKSLLTAGNEVVIGVNGNGISSQMVENRFSSVDPNTAAENLQQTALNFWMMHDFYDDLTAQVHQVRRVRLPSVGLFVSPLTVSYFYGIARNGIYKSRVIDVQQNIQAVVAPSFEARFEYMSQIGIYGSYLENSVIEELFDYELGRGVSATQVLLEANAQQIPIYAITAENIDTVLPLLAVSQEVKTDIINGIHAGQHAIVPQREIQHGNWQGSGYIIQDSITGAGAYLLEGGLNGGALEGLSCDASKNPMAALINMVIQVMELYFNIVAMISFGSFALAAVALVAFRIMVKTLLKAVVKKQVKKKRAKKRKKKKRTECDCDKKKKKTRKGKTGKDECEPELKLVSVEFVKDLPIYKDQIGKAPEITGAQWQDKTFDGEPEIDEPIAYVSSQSGTNKKACEAKKATCLTVTAKFKVTHLPDNWKNKSIRIQGKVSGSSRDNEGNEKRFNTKLLGKTKLPEKLGEIVKIEKVMSEKALPKKITQFYDTLNIKWQFFAFDTKEVKWIQTSKHQVYVTFDKPYLEEMEALYLSALHFAVSNDGATSKQEVVEKSWQMFTQKDMGAVPFLPSGEIRTYFVDI